MMLNLQHSPFLSISGNKQGLDEANQDGHSLDHLGKSTVGELYWNNGMNSLGLVCGSSENELSTIVRRLIASHLKDSEANVLVLHTDHSSIRRGPCPLLDLTSHSAGQQPLVLVSPHDVTSVIEAYTSHDILAAPLISKESNITARHVLALFTPPAQMKGASSILGAVQLILTQLGEPFDLQRFIELMDQETWSEEGVNFITLRQTLLLKLLSPLVEDAHQDKPPQVVLVDLTDPILWNTGLDSSIMDIAVYDFIRSRRGRQLIVLNKCEQYLTHSSNLTRTLEAIAAPGDDRSTGIIFSTTDPTGIPSSILNFVDYVIFGSSRSSLWTTSLRKHFAIEIPKAQLRSGRAMIWSPESTSLMLGGTEAASQQPWNDDQAFVDIEQLKQSMPVTKTGSNLAGIHLGEPIPKEDEEKATGSSTGRKQGNSMEIIHEYEGIGVLEEGEEGMVTLGELRYSLKGSHLTSFRPMASMDKEYEREAISRRESKSIQTKLLQHELSNPSPSGNPAALAPVKKVVTDTVPYGETGHSVDATQKDSEGTRLHNDMSAGSGLRRSGALFVALKRHLISILTERKRAKVRVDELARLLQTECRWAHLGFFLSVIAQAEEENLLMRKRDEDGVEWAYLRRPDTSDNATPVRPAKNIERTAPGEPKLIQRNLKQNEVLSPTSSTSSIPLDLANVKENASQSSMESGKEEYLVPMLGEPTITVSSPSLPRPTYQSGPASKFAPLISIISMLGDGKPGTLVEYVAVKKELRNRKHEMRRLGWTSAKLGPILDAACQAKVVESIGFHPTITYLTLLPPPLGLKSTTVHLAPNDGEMPLIGGNTVHMAKSHLGPPTTDPGSDMPAAVLSQQAGTTFKLGQSQIIARMEPLIACISRLGGNSTVDYKVVRQEMRSRRPEIERLGWSDFGMLMEAACRENVVEAIKKKGKGKIKSLRLTPQTLRAVPLAQAAPTEYPEVGTPTGQFMKATDYPLEHLPVVLTMLRLLSLSPGAGVSVTELAETLGRDFPSREDKSYLISRAEGDGIISTDEYRAYLNRPPERNAPLATSGTVVHPTPPTWFPAHNLSHQLTPAIPGTSHPLVTSSILELTGGAWGTKVRLADLNALLRRNCPGTEHMASLLVTHAKEDGLLSGEMDDADMVWVRLRSPPGPAAAASSRMYSPPASPANLAPSSTPETGVLNPGPAVVLRRLIPEHYPLAHREVVATILRLTQGIMGTKIRVEDLSSELAHDFPFSQDPWHLIFEAQDKGILGLEKDKTGVTWAYLKHPHPPVVAG